MKRLWKIAGIATLVAVLGIVAVGAVAYAQDDGSGWPFDFGGRFREAIADILGISVEEYDAAVEQAQEQVVDEAVAEGWLTEEQAERMQERMQEHLEQGFGRRGMGKGFTGPREGFMGRGGDSLVAVAAEKLDMSVQDLFAELQEGKSIAAVAQEKGVDTQDIVDAVLAQLEETLTQAVEDGKLTQERADWMLEQANETVPEKLNDTWEGRGPGGLPRGGRPGGMRGFPGQEGAPKGMTDEA